MPISLDPNNILTPSIPPLTQHLSPSLQPLPSATADPHEDETGIGGESGDGEGLEVVPCERGGEGGVDEDDVEFAGVEGGEGGEGEVGGG
jgi:hypothetical protein